VPLRDGAAAGTALRQRRRGSARGGRARRERGHSRRRSRSRATQAGSGGIVDDGRRLALAGVEVFVEVALLGERRPEGGVALGEVVDARAVPASRVRVGGIRHGGEGGVRPRHGGRRCTGQSVAMHVSMGHGGGKEEAAMVAVLRGGRGDVRDDQVYNMECGKGDGMPGPRKGVQEEVVMLCTTTRAAGPDRLERLGPFFVHDVRRQRRQPHAHTLTSRGSYPSIDTRPFARPRGGAKPATTDWATMTGHVRILSSPREIAM